MTQGKRVGLATAQRTEVWSRWKTGQSLHRIGRAFGKERQATSLEKRPQSAEFQATDAC